MEETAVARQQARLLELVDLDSAAYDKVLAVPVARGDRPEKARRQAMMPPT